LWRNCPISTRRLRATIHVRTLADMVEVRRRSWDLCKQLDLPVNESLPALEGDLILRPASEIVDRALVLSVVVATAYGFKRGKEWVETEGLVDSLSPQERDLVFFGEGHPVPFQWRAETLTTFAWMLGRIDKRSWTDPVPDRLVDQFPDLRTMESGSTFRERASLQSQRECVEMLDQAYCLHWACRDLDLRGERHNVDTEILVERRWALEWSLGKAEWDDVSLDT
jgi:hypothetical protein